MSATPVSFVPTTQIPLIWGAIVSCGLPGDELSGTVNSPLFTNGKTTMTFYLPTQEASIQVALCLIQIGSPTNPVVVNLYTKNQGTLLATGNIQPSQVTSSSAGGWSGFVTLSPLSSVLSADYYTLTATSPSSFSTSYYLSYINFYTYFTEDINATASYVPPSGTAYGGQSGSPVIWVTDSNGNDLTLFPFGRSGDTSLVGVQTFQAISSYQINCITPWLSDMEFLSPPYTADFVLKDETYSIIAGTASATQYYNSHGLSGIQPLQFSTPVNIVAGHTYSITIQESGHASQNSAYPGVVRTTSINPAKAGPGGKSGYWFGQFVLSDFTQYRVLDYGGITTTGESGHGAIGGTDMLAARIVPNYNETITEVKLKMCNIEDCPAAVGNYSSGTTMIISLYASNENASAPEFATPTGNPLAAFTTDSGNVPIVGFFNMTVSFTVTSGTPYWITWGANTTSNSFFDVQRCVSPYRNLVVATTNSGSTWSFLGQGPSDLAFAAVASSETLGSPFDNTIEATINSASLIGQPFILSEAAIINTIYVLPYQLEGTINVSIHPDNNGSPNISSSLGAGSFNTAFLYFYSGAVIPLSTTVSAQANTKYWAVFSSPTAGGSNVALATYWSTPSDPSIPTGYTALASTNSGISWSAANAEVCSTIFMVGIEPSGLVVPTTSIAQVLAAKNINTYGVVAYGQPSLNSSQVDFYTSQGFKIFPWEDGTDGYNSGLLTTYEQWSEMGGGVLAPLNGWGYITQQYNLGNGLMINLYPNEQEFYLAFTGVKATSLSGQNILYVSSTSQFSTGNAIIVNWNGANQEFLTVGSITVSSMVMTTNLTHTHSSGEMVTGTLTPATSFAVEGIVIDAPELITAWLYEYEQIDKNVGLENLLGIAGWVNSDHPVNYGGAQGASGAHNMNTYTRYVNSPLDVYLNDVTNVGLHKVDNTSCMIWYLVDTAASYSSVSCEPSLLMAVDVNNYHHAQSIGGTVSITQSSSMSIYCAGSNAYLEYQLLIALQSKTIAFARTAMPIAVLQLVPNYYTSVLELTGANTTNTAGDGQTFLSTGGSIIQIPYFNFCNPSDDSSNPGGGFSNATPATVFNFWLNIVPAFAQYPFMEADTDTSQIVTQVNSTSWGHFGPLYGGMPYVGGFFGFQQNETNVLIIDHQYGNLTNWNGVGIVAHAYGTDSYESLTGLTLSNFNVILGLPNSNNDSTYSSDIALIKTYVSQGGNLILYTNSGALSSLTGIGTTATEISYGHPILEPYAQSDLNVAFPSGVYGYINAYSSGKVITLTSYGYGDGFGVGDSYNGVGNSDGLSSGLAYLTLNAILWVTSQTIPSLYLPQYLKRTSWAVPLNGNNEGGTPNVLITVCGTTSGSKLVWLSNTYSSTETVQVSLSQEYFGTPTSWAAYNQNSSSNATVGSGDVALNVTVPMLDWMPLYMHSYTTSTTPFLYGTVTRLIIVEV